MTTTALKGDWAVSAFDMVPVSLFIMDRELRLRYQNAKLQALNGPDSLLQVGTSVPAYVRQVYNESAAEILLGNFSKTLADGEPFHLQSWTLARRTGAPADRQFDVQGQRWSGPRGELGLLITITEVSAHAHAVVTARSAEARYRALVAATTQMVWISDAHGAVVDDVPSWRALTGQSRDQVLGSGWMDAVICEDRARVESAWRHSLAAQAPHEIRFRIRDVAGQQRTLMAHVVPVQDDQGQVREWIGTYTDISATSAAEDSSTAGREWAKVRGDRLEALLQGLPQMVWTAAPDGGLDYVSRMWTDFTGLEMEAALGSGWAQAVHPDDRAAAAARWGHSLTSGEDYEHKFRLRRIDGDYRWFLVRAWTRRQPAGQIIHWLGTCTDIHGQVMAENRLHFLNQATVLMASSLDYWQTLPQVAGLAVPEIADWCAIDLAAPGGGLQQLAVAHIDPERVRLAAELHRDYPHRKGSATIRVLESGIGELIGEISDGMLVAAARDEHHLHLLRTLGFSSCAILPLRARDRTVGVLTLVHAESRRCFSENDRRFLEDLAQRIATAIDTALLFRAEADKAHELGQRNSELDRFATAAAHDMQSPLRTVVSYLGLLELREKESLAPAARAWIRTASEAAMRMRNVLDALLGYARGGHVKAEDLGLVPLAEVVAEALANLEAAINESGATIVIDDLPTIRGSRTHLLMLFQNLISNSLKYRERSRPLRVSISSVAVADGWQVMVQDNGQGIPADCRGRLFTLFERFHHEESGSGIGLATSKRIVDLHGGNISLMDAHGAPGATFGVRLPR